MAPSRYRRASQVGSRAVRIARLFAVVALVTGAAAIGAAGASARAGGSERILNYDVNIMIEDTGDLLVTETIDYDFGVVPRHGIFRDIPVRYSDYVGKKEHFDRIYRLDVESVRATEGTPAEYTVENAGGSKRIKIGDPDRTITGEHSYEITYRIEGALTGFEDHDELYWDAIGEDWAVIIQHISVTVEAPADITEVACFSGSFGSTLPCTSAGSEGTTAQFSQEELFPFQAMSVVVGIPKGAVPPPEPILDETWWFGRGFQLTTANVGGFAVLSLLVIGAFALLAFKRGRDRRYAGSHVDAAFGSAEAAESAKEETVPLGGEDETPVEFVPPDNLRPGQVGTLVDFTAHPLDVTATIVDLAVRGFLVIEEIPDSNGRKPDWKLTKKKEPDGLEQYEVELMTGLFGSEDEVELSGLRYKFAAKMGKVQKALTADAMKRGWFTKPPGAVRLGFGCLGVLVFLLGVALFVLAVAFTELALWPIPIIGLGIALTVGAYWMPARTAKGYAVLRRTDGFRRFIEESEKERAKFAEKKNLFSEYLPYAIVFGAVDKWAKAFGGLDDQPPDTSSWYVGTTAFSYYSFGHAMDGFTVSSAGTLSSTPPSTSSSSGSSGFSGGGSSGGGGGGGGGGSW
jgi:uncharacterized membrane protein YgcG